MGGTRLVCCAATRQEKSVPFYPCRKYPDLWILVAECFECGVLKFINSGRRKTDDGQWLKYLQHVLECLSDEKLETLLPGLLLD
jgi:hypothetical protein